MGMDILGLQARAATLINNNTVPESYRVNAEKLKTDLQKAKEEGNIKDLFQVSEKGQEEIDRVHAMGTEGMRILCNYSRDVFFTRDMPKVANADGSYTISGVSFSEDELVRARDAMKTAADIIGLGAGKNINIDYRNYAEMALAENAVKQYAGKALNKEQQEVVTKAMQEYNAGLVDLQDNLLAENNFVKNDYGRVSDYYGLSRVMSEEDAQLTNKLKAELSRLTGKPYKESKAGDLTGLTQIATNQDLTKKITELFQNVDLSDKKSVDFAVKQYQELMKPVYQASQMMSPSKAGEMAAREAGNFFAAAEKVMAYASYKSVDFLI